MNDARSDALLLFGATGDLARRKLFPSIYWLAARGRLGVPIVGVARSPLGDADLAARVRAAVEIDPVQFYEPGSVGPSEADRLIIDHDGSLPCTEPAYGPTTP